MTTYRDVKVMHPCKLSRFCQTISMYSFFLSSLLLVCQTNLPLTVSENLPLTVSENLPLTVSERRSSPRFFMRFVLLNLQFFLSPVLPFTASVYLFCIFELFFLRHRYQSADDSVISCCVFVLFVFFLCTVCCHFLWIVHFCIAFSVLFNVYYTPAQSFLYLNAFSL